MADVVDQLVASAVERYETILHGFPQYREYTLQLEKAEQSKNPETTATRLVTENDLVSRRLELEELKKKQRKAERLADDLEHNLATLEQELSRTSTTVPTRTEGSQWDARTVWTHEACTQVEGSFVCRLVQTDAEYDYVADVNDDSVLGALADISLPEPESPLRTV